MKKIKFKSLLLTVMILVLSVVSPAMAAQTDTEEITKEEQQVEEIREDTGEQLLPSEENLDKIDVEKLGTIRIVLTDGKTGTKKSGIKFYCIQVAEWEAGEFILTEAYRNVDVNLNEIENSNGLDAAAKKMAEYQAEGKKSETDQNGEVIFSELQPGVYLLKAEDNNNYDTISPALVAIPAWNEQDGEMQYEVSVEPKHTPKPDEKKNTAPQTGLKDYTVQYLGIAGICFLGAFLLFLFGIRSKKGNRK